MKKITETERLILAEITLDDASFIKQLLNSPKWLEFIGDKGVTTNEQAVQYISSNLIGSYKNNGFGLYKLCLKDSETPIGLCGFLQRDYLESQDIGFALLPEFEGRGYMLEACKAIMDYGESQLNLWPILAIVMDKNSRSRQLLEKIGLYEKGIVKPDGGETHLLLYSSEKATR